MSTRRVRYGIVAAGTILTYTVVSLARPRYDGSLLPVLAAAFTLGAVALRSVEGATIGSYLSLAIWILLADRIATSLALESAGAMGDFFAVGMLTFLGWFTLKHPEAMFGGGSTSSSSNTDPLDDDMWDEEPEEAAGDGPTVVQDAVEDTLWGDDSE